MSKRKPLFDTTPGHCVSARWSDYKLRVVFQVGRKQHTILIHANDLRDMLRKAEDSAAALLAQAKNALNAGRAKEQP